jgi:hypothetical protein
MRKDVRKAKAEYAKRALLYERRNNPRRPISKAIIRKAGHGKAKASSKAKPVELEMSTIVAVERAMEDKSTPAVDGLTREKAALLTNRRVRRWFGPRHTSEPEIGLVRLAERETDDSEKDIWFEIGYPKEVMDKPDKIDLDALLTGEVDDDTEDGDGPVMELVLFAEMSQDQLMALSRESLAAEAKLFKPKLKIPGGTSNANKPSLATGVYTRASVKGTAKVKAPRELSEG